ncbi:MAG: tetratricopeptide repeat protein, partial [Chloroflexota bacterium]|nr:tetratricopeptide repeat protein [Chloroflexota bacterium]
QVLLSLATGELLHDRLPADAVLRDLGEHRLKDLARPERIFQLVVPDLPSDFPPLVTLDHRPNNLPVQPTPLVGRDAILAELEALLTRDDVRLITLTGMGGTGKTRLGLQVAAEVLEAFADGVFFVDLAPIRDPRLVLPTIAAALGVRETGAQSLRDTLVTFLAEKRLLLLLDNFEQVLDAASTVADLLAACAAVKILLTSRAPLGLRAEHEFQVPPLATPEPKPLPPLAELAEIESVALFVQRATAARHDFALTATNAASVAEICARLEGLPLAIELAAARVKTLPPRVILERLGSGLTLLTGGARDLPARQRTLRATIEWSYGLLTADEQTLFRRLAVFAGGVNLSAAEAVVASDGALNIDVLDGIRSLVDQSLLRAVNGLDDEARFTMQELLRAFGIERLAEVGETETMQRAHAAWCLALAEEAASHLMGPEQGAWLARLEMEHDNLRAALAWCLGGTDPVGGARLAGALGWFWYSHGYLSEGRRWLERALELPIELPPEVRAGAFNWAAMIATDQADREQALALRETALALYRQLGDSRGIARSLYHLASEATKQGDFERAVALLEEEEALGRETMALDQGAEWSNMAVSAALNGLGELAFLSADFSRATVRYEESLRLSRAAGNTFQVADALANLGEVWHHRGDLERATEFYSEALDLFRELGHEPGIAFVLFGMGRLALTRDDAALATRLLTDSLLLLDRIGRRSALAECLESLAGAVSALGESQLSVRLLAAGATLRETLELPRPPVYGEEYERQVAIARAAMDKQTFSKLWAAGSSAPLDRVITEITAFAAERAPARVLHHTASVEANS